MPEPGQQVVQVFHSQGNRMLEPGLIIIKNYYKTRLLISFSTESFNLWLAINPYNPKDDQDQFSPNNLYVTGQN